MLDFRKCICAIRNEIPTGPRYSLHLSEMYGHNHAFFDPNIWHLDEELRKQVESFAKCFILTGQEAPETSKKFHVDLYKKTISADGIMGRKPYGYSTRMFHTIGWTRLEVNRIMQFLGVKNNTFNSMFRRSLVWKAKARFIHKKFLAKYADHEKDGIFEADPSLNKFLTTSQASIAGLRLQWAFEADHSKDDCYQIIENYCNGGDGYLTEDVMRSACGLPLRQRNLQTEEGLANLLNADAESEAERDTKKSTWTCLRETLVDHMLEKDLESISFYEFKKMPMNAETHPNLTRNDMWDAMKGENVVLSGIGKGKTTKDKPGVYLPVLQFGADFASVRPPAKEDVCGFELEEEHDIGMIRRYAYRCRGRTMNDENLSTFYSSLLPNLQKKGRRTNDVVEILAKYQGLVQKVKDHEERLATLLASRKRRLTEKKSAEGSALLESHAIETSPITKWPSSLVSRAVQYHYSDKQKYSVTARRYGSSGSAQSMSRRLQKQAVDSHTLDLDIHNCALTLLHQIVKKTEPKPPLPAHIAKVFDEVATDRSTFISKLNVDAAEGKKIINTVLNGGAPPASLKSNELIILLQKLSIYLRWVAVNLLYEDYMLLRDCKDKNFPSASIMSLMWQSVEDMILQAWLEHVLAMKPKHLSLHFDGIRVSKTIVDNVDSHLEQCQKVIKQKTGFDVKITVKTHGTFRELVEERGTPCSAGKNIPPQILVAGNCIPCGLWHCFPTSRASIAAFVQDATHKENEDAKKLGYRSYRSMAKAAGVDLVCCPGLPPETVKSFLLHYEGNGHPHCIGIKHDTAGGCVTILDGSAGLRVTARELAELASAAVDEFTIISYWLHADDSKPESKNAILLDMVAGAGKEESDSSQDVADKEMVHKGFDENQEHLVVDDGILDMLKNEVAAMVDEARKPKHPVNGRHQCPACPFRSFRERRRMRIHLEKHHGAKNQYVSSGTKQLKVILALYDHAASSQTTPSNLLRESASILRNSVKPALASSSNLIDKRIRLIYDATGPRYINVSQLETELHVRRVRNRYYTKAFADLLLQEAVLSHAQARCIHNVFFFS